MIWSASHYLQFLFLEGWGKCCSFATRNNSVTWRQKILISCTQVFGKQLNKRNEKTCTRSGRGLVRPASHLLSSLYYPEPTQIEEQRLDINHPSTKKFVGGLTPFHHLEWYEHYPWLRYLVVLEHANIEGVKYLLVSLPAFLNFSGQH